MNYLLSVRLARFTTPLNKYKKKVRATKFIRLNDRKGLIPLVHFLLSVKTFREMSQDRKKKILICQFLLKSKT